MQVTTRELKTFLFSTARGLSVFVALFLSPNAGAAQYFYNQASDVDWTTLTSVDQANIDTCFRGNVGTCNATTDGKWRSYPQRTNGDWAGDLYNGCYQYRGRDLLRYADLNSEGNCPCPNGESSCAGESLVRVFLGYQTFCPGGAATCTLGGEVRVNCVIETFSRGTGATQIGSYVHNCSDTRPIRLAQSIAVVEASASPGCPAGTYPLSGGCEPCALGTYKEFAGDFACSACPAAAIANGTGISYATTPATGSTSPTACQVSYGCATGFNIGTNPATYSTSGGYVGANCGVNPSPSPSPTCVVGFDAADSTRFISCTYSCGSSLVIYSGRCGDSGPLNKIRTQHAGCALAYPTACSFVAPKTDTCAATTCPTGRYPHLVWDVAGATEFQTLDGGPPSSSCQKPGGETPYFVCASSANPPHVTFGAEFGSCTSVNGWTYSGTKSRTTPPWNGNGYCTY